MVVDRRSGQTSAMADSLDARARLAIEESRRLRAERLLLSRQHVEQREALQLAVFESTMVRAEIKAHRDNEE